MEECYRSLAHVYISSVNPADSVVPFQTGLNLDRNDRYPGISNEATDWCTRIYEVIIECIPL